MAKPLYPDEHYGLMDEVAGDVKKVQAVIVRIEQLAAQAGLAADSGNRRAMIIKVGEILEGIDLLKELFGLRGLKR